MAIEITPPSPQKDVTHASIKRAMGRFVESNVLATLDELEDSGVLDDPHHSLRAVLAAEYGIDDIPRPTAPNLSPSPPSTGKTSIFRRRSTGGTIKRPRGPVRSLSVPLGPLTLRVSLSKTPSPRIDEEVGEDDNPFFSLVRSPSKKEARRRSFDVERAYRIPSSPRAPLPTATALHNRMSKAARHSDIGPITSQPELSSPVQGHRKQSSWHEAQDLARQARQARVTDARPSIDFTKVDIAPLKSQDSALTSTRPSPPRFPLAARPPHLQPDLRGYHIRQAVSEDGTETPIIECSTIFSGGVDVMETSPLNARFVDEWEPASSLSARFAELGTPGLMEAGMDSPTSDSSDAGKQEGDESEDEEGRRDTIKVEEESPTQMRGGARRGFFWDTTRKEYTAYSVGAKAQPVAGLTYAHSTVH